MKKLTTTLFALLFSVGIFATGHTVTIAQTNVTCNGACNGSATATVSGGVGPFSYDWTPGVPFGDGTPTISSLCPGTYNLTVTDNSDMSTATASVIITEPSPLGLAMPGSTTACYGSCVGLVGIPSGGTPAYTYMWSPAAGLSSSVVSAPTACPTTATTYTLLVTDANGCIYSGSTTVLVDQITSNISSTNTTACISASCNGTASVAPTGGSSPYIYLWNDLAASTTASISSLCPGTYSATITDMMGCTVTDSVTISSPPITSNYTMVPDSTSGFNYWAFNTSTGDSLSYIWYFGDGDSSFVRSPLHTYAAIGAYNVCLIVSNPGGCFDVKCTVVIVAGIANSCLSLFNISHDTASANPNAYTVYNLSYGSALSYLWDFGDGATSTLQNPSHVYAGTGSYQLCLSVDNGAGCTEMYCDSLTWVDSLGHASIPLTVTVVGTQFPTGISEHTMHSEISVFPNPFNDVTTFDIKSTKNDVYSFELTDVLGKKVKSITGISDKQFQVSRSGLENGIYFYKIYSSGSIIGVGKLIVE